METLIESEFSCGTGMCRQNQWRKSLILKQGENRIFTLRALRNPGWIYSELPYLIRDALNHWKLQFFDHPGAAWARAAAVRIQAAIAWR